MKEAVQRALDGKGPTLIEAITFRYGAHTTADDPKKYRDQERLSEEWRQERDPLHRLRVYLEKQGLWNEKNEEDLLTRVNEQIDAALVEAESYPKSKPEDMFKHVYAEPTWMATEQEDELVKPSKQEGIPA